MKSDKIIEKINKRLETIKTLLNIPSISEDKELIEIYNKEIEKITQARDTISRYAFAWK